MIVDDQMLMRCSIIFLMQEAELPRAEKGCCHCFESLKVCLVSQRRDAPLQLDCQVAESGSEVFDRSQHVVEYVEIEFTYCSSKPLPSVPRMAQTIAGVRLFSAQRPKEKTVQELV